MNRPVASVFGMTCVCCQVIGFWTTSDGWLFASIASGLSAFVFGLLTFVTHHQQQPRVPYVGIILIALSAFAWWALFPIVEKHHETLIILEKTARMKNIGNALHQFDRHEGRFPPAGLCDELDQPLLSWRVLILPYLGYEQLYSEFRLSEPWDSSHNKALLPLIPREYAPPEEAGIARESYSTFCQVFIGAGTAFDCPQGCRIPEDFPDGISGTILVAEASEAVPWTKPADLSYSRKNPMSQLGPRSTRLFFPGPKQTFFVWGDGEVTSILLDDQKAGEKSLRAAITRNRNGEEKGFFRLRQKSFDTKVTW